MIEQFIYSLTLWLLHCMLYCFDCVDSGSVGLCSEAEFFFFMVILDPFLVSFNFEVALLNWEAHIN